MPQRCVDGARALSHLSHPLLRRRRSRSVPPVTPCLTRFVSLIKVESRRRSRSVSPVTPCLTRFVSLIKVEVPVGPPPRPKFHRDRQYP